MDSWGPDQEVSENKNISNCDSDTSYDSLAKNVPAFCACPKNLLETNLKSFTLISWAEEISWEPNISSVMWLFVIIIIYIYSKKKKKKNKTKNKEQMRQKAIQNLLYNEKQSTRKFNIRAMVCAEKDI